MTRKEGKTKKTTHLPQKKEKTPPTTEQPNPTPGDHRKHNKPKTRKANLLQKASGHLRHTQTTLQTQPKDPPTTATHIELKRTQQTDLYQDHPTTNPPN